MPDRRPCGIVVFMIELAEPSQGDAFGAVLLRCWKAGGRDGVAYEVVERDDGYIGVTDAARYFGPFDSWSEPEQWAYAQVAGRVLDVGCGAGRHAVPLGHRGFDVVGVDASPGAVEVARNRGVNAVVGSADDLPVEGMGPVDTVLLLGNNIGLLGGHEQAHRVLDQLARVTSPGGCLLGSGMDPYRTKRPEHLAYHQLNRSQGRLAGQVRMRVRDSGQATRFFDYLFVAPDELRALVADTPWQLHSINEQGANYAVRLELR